MVAWDKVRKVTWGGSCRPCDPKTEFGLLLSVQCETIEEVWTKEWYHLIFEKIIVKNYFKRLLWPFWGAQIRGGAGGQVLEWQPEDKIFLPIEENPIYSISFSSGSLAPSILFDLGFDVGLRCTNFLLAVQLNTLHTSWTSTCTHPWARHCRGFKRQKPHFCPQGALKWPKEKRHLFINQIKSHFLASRHWT